MTKLFLCVVLVGACGDVDSVLLDAAPDAELDASSSSDAALDASTGRCDPSQPFGMPLLVGRLSSVFDDAALTLTRNERVALLGRENTGSPATVLLAATRSSVTAQFSPPSDSVMALLNNPPGTEHHPSTTADGLLVYFERRSPISVGVFAASRADATSAFGMDTNVTINGAALVGAGSPIISGDGHTLYFVDTTTSQLHSATRGANAVSFGVATLASTVATISPVLSDDERTLLYSEAGEIVISTRTTTSDPFGPGSPLDGVNSAALDAPLALTSDGCVLFLKSTRTGGLGGADIYEAKRP